MILRRTALAATAAAMTALVVFPAAAQENVRPQTPTPPFAYQSEDVSVTSAADGARLVGTLTSPRAAAPAPAILMLSVAGPNDRNLSFAGHQAYAVIADRLTRAGFAVLRLDDRGVGGSEGDWAAASYDVLAADALSALDFLRQRAGVDPARVGVFGLSEGAAIAAMAAARSARPLAFVALASPPGLNGADAIRAQFEQTLAMSGVPAEQAPVYRDAFAHFLDLSRAAATEPARLPELEAFLSGPGRALVPPYGFVPRNATEQARLFAGAWYQSQLALAPAQYYAATRAPMLVIGGGKDLVLPPDLHHPPIRAAAPRAEFVVIDGVSHMLQPTQTGLPMEYAQTAVTVDPRVLEALEGWLLRVT